ncbi:MAG: hypothetical protein KatS3mg001_173 [Candidatus Pacearchaeota archaeon]|nr:MAG: hypothetical protein KatS3mg001_173 [Candidatus Pacearchaeota archaeon]
MNNFNDFLLEAERSLIAADHMVYVSFPLIKDKRLLIKAIQEIKKSMFFLIRAILERENQNKKILTNGDLKLSFKNLKDSIAKKYNLSNNDLVLISEIFEISEFYKESSFEFIRGNKVVFLTEDLKPVSISIEKIKELIVFSKGLIKRVKEK